jgi:membrane protease YdiL (CAAX protease family)
MDQLNYSARSNWMHDLGLRPGWGWLADPRFAPALAAGVLLPALLFGYFRDRHDSVLPAIALHVFYNAGYFLLPLPWSQ